MSVQIYIFCLIDTNTMTHDMNRLAMIYRLTVPPIKYYGLHVYPVVCLQVVFTLIIVVVHQTDLL